MDFQGKVTVVTHIPSPYQVELFNAIAQSGCVSLRIAYVHATHSKRLWQIPEINHECIFLNDKTEMYDEIKTFIESSDLVVFNYYNHPTVIKLIKERAKSQLPWCFWGERPGYHGYGMFGRLYRKLKLSELHHSKVPIWGMGNWAIEEYQKEFGEREIFNVPYFSDLSRFKRTDDKQFVFDGQLRFLFSGSLIYRKGVDLLAEAFARLADEFGNVRLTFLGDGNLRPRLEKRLAKYNGSQVEFSGFKQWKDIPSIYDSSDILCVPSRYDVWNLVVPEGLASGLPVIGTDRTGAALEFISHRENGWLVSSGNAEGLYQAMREAASLSPVELQTISNKARNSVNHHSLQDGVERFCQAVRNSLNACARENDIASTHHTTGFHKGGIQ